jgi:hypothetical protein
LPLGQISDFQITLTPSEVQDLKNGLFYVNVHSANFPAGEIRGQFGLSPSISSIQFNATSYFVGESAGGVVVSVSRSGNTSNPVTINYATSNGTATTPTDYTSSSGTLQFAAGEIVKTFVVPIIDDGLVERTETINLILNSPGAGVMEGSPFTSTVTVLDDDKPMLVLEENTSRAAALDSSLFLRDPFRVGNVHNFSSDQRTRIMLFTTGIELDSTESTSSLLVQLEDTQNRIFPLVVEDIRKVPNFDFSQIVVKLPDSIDIDGDYHLSLTFRGTTGNKPQIRVLR